MNVHDIVEGARFVHCRGEGRKQGTEGSGDARYAEPRLHPDRTSLDHAIDCPDGATGGAASVPGLALALAGPTPPPEAGSAE